jgi:enamine deaminase RidA (YjgF/YER057c/UK114 family)
MVEFSNPAGVPAPSGLYSQSAVVSAGTDLVFISGQIGVRTDGSVGATIEEQADIAFGHLVTILKSHGLGPMNIVKMQIFLTDRGQREATAAARRKHLGDHKPTTTLVIVAGLGHAEYLIEVEAIAAR